MNKTIYITDEKVWERARVRARMSGKSLSSVIEKALEDYTAPNDLTPMSDKIAEAVQGFLGQYVEGAVTSPEVLLRIHCEIGNWLAEIEQENNAILKAFGEIK